MIKLYCNPAVPEAELRAPVMPYRRRRSICVKRIAVADRKFPPAGPIVQTIGFILDKLFKAAEYRIFANQDFLWRIRGNDNCYQIRAEFVAHDNDASNRNPWPPDPKYLPLLKNVTLGVVLDYLRDPVTHGNN